MGYYVDSAVIDVRISATITDDIINTLSEDGFHFDQYDGAVWLNFISSKWTYVYEGLLMLAPHVIEPGVIYFQGEDNNQWKVVFDDNMMSTYEGTVSYEETPSGQVRY